MQRDVGGGEGGDGAAAVGVAGRVGVEQERARGVRNADGQPQRGGGPSRAVLARAAVREQLDDAVDQRQPLLGVVVDDDQRRPAVGDGAGDGLADQRRAGRIELRGRFVEQQQPGARGQRPGEHEALLLPAGEGRGGAVAPVRERHRGERPVHGRPDLLRRRPDVLQPERDVVPGAGHHQLGVGVLEDDRRAGAGEVGEPAVDRRRALGLTGVRAEQPCQRVQQRGLARAGGAGEQHPLAGRDRQVDVPHGPGVAARVPEAPAGEPYRGRAVRAGRSGSRGQTRVRPDPNDDSAPLAPSARASASPPTPATTAVLTTTSTR